MVVTAVSSGRIAIGGILTSANGYSGQIIAQISGAPGGVGVYNVWYGARGNLISVPPGTALSETYGILTLGGVNSGTVAVGQEVTGNGVTGNTAIQHHVRGSGAGSEWVVDLTQTVASEAMAMKAAPLAVTNHAVTGATVNSDSFWIEVNGDYFVPPTSMTYASGTAAGLLGLTQSTGAYLSTPGQITTSPSAWLNNIVNNENSHWSSFQMTYPTASDTADELSDWSAASGGQFQYLSGYTTTTPPIVPSSSAAEIVDPAGTYSGPGASAPTQAAAGTYIPVTGATSAAAEIVDPAGTYSPAGASAPIADPGGTYSAADASAPTTDPAGTYSSPYALDRLFLTADNKAPTSSVLSFHSATAVANYFGVTSGEASLANEFFAGYGGAPATMLISRYSLGGERSHLFGANVTNLTLSQLQSISGSLSIVFQGYTYSGSINLSGVQSFSAAATAIQSTLNSSAPVAAVTSGSSIAPVSVSFTGSLDGFLLRVTSVSSGRIELGAQFSGPGIGAGAEIVVQNDGTPGGPGLYTLYTPKGNTSSETMTESYGVLTVGSVTSGTVADGQEVTGAGVASLTGIEDNLSGSGAGSTWLVNNAQTVAPESMTNKATPLSVTYNPIVGVTANRDYFEVSTNGDFGFDYNPSSLSYMGGSAAAALGLTQASGALDSTMPVGQPMAAPYMNNLVQYENSQFGSFQAVWPQLANEDPSYLGDLAAWAQSTYGPYQFLSQTVATPPAGSSMPTTDPPGTYSGPGASAPTQDPPGTFSPAGASAPMLAAAGTYIPGAGATSSAAELVDPAGTYSGAGASAATLAQPGYYVPTAGASSETPVDRGYYTPYAGATAEIKALPAIISDRVGGRSTASGQTDTRFSSVEISDPNIATSDSLLIQLTGSGDMLADGAGFTGLITASAPGVYLLSGTAGAITSELDALVFTPSAGSGTTTLTLTDTTSLGTSASDANTTVTVLPASEVAARESDIGQYGASVAYSDATPSAIDAIFAANPLVQAAFGSSPDIYAIGEIGGGHASAGTDSETSSANVPIDVNPANLGHNEELTLGFANGDLLGAAGVTAVSLTVSDGGQQLIDQNFATPAAARSYFDDNIASGLLLLSPGGAATTLSIGLTVQTDRAGSGLYGEFIVGGVPEKCWKAVT